MIASKGSNIETETHLNEACNVGTGKKGWKDVAREVLPRELLASVEADLYSTTSSVKPRFFEGMRRRAYLEAFSHDVLELRVDFLGSPGETLAVLGHLETGDGDTTAVGSLCGRERMEGRL